MRRLLFFLLSLTAATLAYAQVPGTLSYQGILVNVAGNPVADGNHTVTFNFHKTATGGLPTFARGPFTVSTFKGLFTLVLGTGTPATVNDPLPVLASDPNYIGNTQYYLELVADNVILSPRVSLSSMPYAFTAQNANTMNAAGLTGTVDNARLEPKVDITELTVGSSSQLAVSTTGNITKINNVTTSFPAAQGTANTILSNDGSGNLSWISPSTSTGGWGLTGNAGTTPGSNFIGTSDAKDIVFKTNNVERARLTSAGNLGIGTTTPYVPLHVAGSIAVGASEASGYAWNMELISTKLSPISNRITFGTDGTGYKFAIGKNQFGTVSDLLTIQDNGNIGIGTTNALGKLDVFGGPITFGGTLNNFAPRPALTSTPINNEIWAYNSAISTADDGFLRISAGGGTGAGAKSFIDISGFSTVADMNANITFGTAGAEKMRIDIGGNVGIGTTAPTRLLHLKSSNSGNNGLAVENSNAVNGASQVQFLDQTGAEKGAITYNNGVANRMLFSVNGTNDLILDGINHRVGVGPENLNPLSTLDVAGDIRLAQTTAPTTTTDKLYNVNGNLTWNGVTMSNGNTGSNHFFGLNAGSSNTTGTENHFEGYSAGAANTTGTGNHFSGFQAGMANTTGISNVFIGYHAGINNTTGFSNFFAGYGSGGNNSTGYYNTFLGLNAGAGITTGNSNIAIGVNAGALLGDAINNVLIGNNAGPSSSGSLNHFVGYSAGYVNTTGTNNHFEGMSAGNGNTTGSNNHFEGYLAGTSNTTGSNNTVIGYLANVSTGALTNATAIGNGAVVNASNKIVLGNASATTVGGYGSFTNYSDRRLKDNIVYTSDLGLNFIMQLKPATYYYKKDENRRFRNGLIAQDVQQTLQQLGLKFSGLVEDDDQDKTLNLSYADFVMPLITAVQEQQKTIESQEEKIKELENKIVKLNNTLTAELNAIKKQLGMEVKAETSSSSTDGHK